MKRCAILRVTVSTLIGLITIAVLQAAAIGQGTSKAQAGGDRNPQTNEGDRLFFVKDAYRGKDTREYVNIVWDQFVVKVLKNEDLKLFHITKEDVVLALVDLDRDGKKDILASIVNNEYFCGTSGKDCALIALVSSSGSYKPIESCISVLWQKTPVRALTSYTNGLRDIMINNGFTLRFNGKEYCDK